MVKNPPANAGDAGLIPESGRSPGEGNGNSPWGREKSDTTERLSTHIAVLAGV